MWIDEFEHSVREIKHHINMEYQPKGLPNPLLESAIQAHKSCDDDALQQGFSFLETEQLLEGIWNNPLVYAAIIGNASSNIDLQQKTAEKALAGSDFDVWILAVPNNEYSTIHSWAERFHDYQYFVLATKAYGKINDKPGLKKTGESLLMKGNTRISRICFEAAHHTAGLRDVINTALEEKNYDFAIDVAQQIKAYDVLDAIARKAYNDQRYTQAITAAIRSGNNSLIRRYGICAYNLGHINLGIMALSEGHFYDELEEIGNRESDMGRYEVAENAFRKGMKIQKANSARSMANANAKSKKRYGKLISSSMRAM